MSRTLADIEADMETATAPEPETEEKGAKSVATLLVDMAHEDYTFGVSDDSTPYATPKSGPLITYLLRGGRDSLRARLALKFWQRYKKAAPQQALADALGTIEGFAREADPRRLYQRVAKHEGAHWLDLGDNTGRAVRIQAGGWTVENRPPILFRRTPLTGGLPTPDPTGTIDELWQSIRIAEADQPLVLAYLVAALDPDLAHPILYLGGEQGGGKTTTAKQLVCLLDDGPVPYRKAPRDAEAWVTAAMGSFVIALDNLSTVPDWLSDLLCRAVTGEGDVRRRFYTDGDLAVFSFRRCIILTGIDLGSLNGDLADRLLPVTLDRIEPSERRTEEAIWADWQRAHPRLLGAVLNLAASVASVLPTLALGELPRMAGYARILAAVDQLLGTKGYAHHLGAQGRLAADTLTGDPFTTAIVEAITSPFEGTSAQLLEAVTPETEKWKRPKEWPTTPRAATQRMRRQAPVLRKVGWHVSDDGGANKSNAILWRIVPPEPESDRHRYSLHSPTPLGRYPERQAVGAATASTPKADNSPDSPRLLEARHGNAGQDVRTSAASGASVDNGAPLSSDDPEPLTRQLIDKRDSPPSGGSGVRP